MEEMEVHTAAYMEEGEGELKGNQYVQDLMTPADIQRKETVFFHSPIVQLSVLIKNTLGPVPEKIRRSRKSPSHQVTQISKILQSTNMTARETLNKYTTQMHA
jgi:hypothetical protein